MPIREGVRPFPGSRAGEPAEKVWRMNDKREHMDTCEYIDLGLPSGILWASENAFVPATSLEEYESGRYFPTLFEFDEAVRLFGDALSRPEEFQELCDVCDWTWIEKKAGDRVKAGYKVTGPNGKSVFFPAEGFMLKGDWFECGPDAWDGYYWSNMATMDGTYAYCLVINDIDYNWQWNEPRKYGMSVRLVKRRRKSKSKKG